MKDILIENADLVFKAALFAMGISLAFVMAAAALLWLDIAHICGFAFAVSAVVLRYLRR